jgi:hypothetical protein
LDEFHTEIKRALPTDAEDFVAFVLISSPPLFLAICRDGVGGYNAISFRLHDFIVENGYEIAGVHEEEYLTMPKAKVQKTLIRYPIRKK